MYCNDVSYIHLFCLFLFVVKTVRTAGAIVHLIKHNFLVNILNPPPIRPLSPQGTNARKVISEVYAFFV